MCSCGANINALVKVSCCSVVLPCCTGTCTAAKSTSGWPMWPAPSSTSPSPPCGSRPVAMICKPFKNGISSQSMMALRTSIDVTRTRGDPSILNRIHGRSLRRHKPLRNCVIIQWLVGIACVESCHGRDYLKCFGARGGGGGGGGGR